jgi:hypothetical protein
MVQVIAGLTGSFWMHRCTGIICIADVIVQTVGYFDIVEGTDMNTVRVGLPLQNVR